MSTGIAVDLRSAVPPYEQIRLQVTSLIAMGSLAPGTRLPTVRSLAADLGIAAGTVARAYKELEQAGLTETRRRNGTIVLRMPDDGLPPGGVVTADVIAAVDRYIAEGRGAGLDDGTLQGILRVRLGLSRLGQ
ncbi:GntR family transcriptional regulator [Arthrobacter sp. B10-11]|uniref:GntR family transcriptional regulator n=1 Tax=Arthrobacter sp. B10-11 TaxID=3081160 RepID=UPI002955A199|nr:GntR family transcriptional regulator [Arthrobacter sp. B10-11]MDV8146820.1 GntR family transcriptional regulator [Arthrobacter sp. B10-11]